MATQNLSAQAAEGNTLPQWRQERIRMARGVWENILDPIMTFAELVRCYNHEKGPDFTLEEISAVLRLLILGAHTELKVCCSEGGFLSHIGGEQLDEISKKWDTGAKGGAA